jgi:phosphopantothenate synthetase
VSLPGTSPTNPAGDRRWDAAAEHRAREFDYGVGDDQDEAARNARRAAAAEIRRAAASEPGCSPAVLAAYERAARLAEGSGSRSADQLPPRIR